MRIFAISLRIVMFLTAISHISTLVSNHFRRMMYEITDGMISAHSSDTRARCSAICNQNEQCNAFQWESPATTGFAPNCHTVQLPEYPVLVPTTGPVLYISENYPISIKSDMDGYFGVWSDNLLCPPNSFAHGFYNIYDAYNSIELPPGGQDDCGMTGVNIFCQTLDGINVSSIHFDQQHPSQRIKKTMMCPAGDFVDGYQMKVSAQMYNGDDDSMSAVFFHCHNSGSWLKSHGAVARSGTKSQETYCTEGMRMCGIRIKYEEYLLSSQDNTCINEILGLCCFIP